MASLKIEMDMANRQVINYGIFYKLDPQLNARPEQFKFLGHEWKYRAEGNSNLVITLQDERRVIRLRKHAIDEEYKNSDWTNEKKKLLREVIFSNHVFAPLIGSEFVGSVEIIRISPEQIYHLNNALRSIRPKSRLHKELGMPFATSRPDFTRINSSSAVSPLIDYCVEIKPKQGCWSHTILGERSTLCTFCLNQFLKIKHKKTQSRTDYCPLDLFSGNPVRMITALMALIYNPQNNLRVFKNGNLVYGENMPPESLLPILDDWISYSNVNVSAEIITTPEIQNPLHNFMYLICMALLKPQNLVEQTEDSSRVDKHFELFKNQLLEILATPGQSLTTFLRNENCDPTSSTLPEKSLLARILYAQKLGHWGNDSIYSLYKKICHIHANSKTGAPCPSSKCFVEDKWLDELPVLPTNELETLCIENYLLAATVRDCSLMITFSPLGNDLNKANSSANITNSSLIQDLTGGFHHVRIGVADLDPKPVTCIPRHYLRDLEMLQAYKNFTFE